MKHFLFAFLCLMMLVAFGCQSNEEIESSSLPSDDIVEAAHATYAVRIRAIRGGTPDPTGEIHPRYWADGIRALSPIKVYIHRTNVVVVELKRDRTPRDTLAQALEYVSFAGRLDTEQLQDLLRSYLNDESLSLAEHHREYFELSSDEAVAFNKDQRIAIVGQQITSEIRQTASYLRSKGVRVTCLEFTFFQTDGGTCLLSQEIVVGHDSDRPAHVISGSLPVVTEESFLNSLDENGNAIFSRILEFAREKKMPIHWGTKGFSLNVELGGTHVAICFGYPPESVYKQSIYTALRGRGGMTSKTTVPEDVLNTLWRKAESTGLFTTAGRELKCLLDHSLSNEEMTSLLDWLETVVNTVFEHGLKE